jgi:GAF domain-containing protein
MCAPLIFGDRVIGIITCDKHEPDFYDDDLAELLTAFAAQAATAIENARLLATERAAREEAETLQAAAQSVGSSLNLADVCDLILSEPVTNVASRLSTHATGGQILVGQRVHAAVEERVDAGPVGELELKGFGRPITAYEVRGVRGQASR